MPHSDRRWSDRKNWVMGIVAALLVSLLGWVVSKVFIKPPPQDGLVLKEAVKAETPLTNDLVIVGPSDGHFPQTLFDLRGMCADRELPEGTRLTAENVKPCDPD